MKRRHVLACVLMGLAYVTPAQSQVSDNAVKIGVLTDMAGVVADISGKGSAIAAKWRLKSSAAKCSASRLNF